MEIFASYLKSPVGIIKITADRQAAKAVSLTSGGGGERENEITKEAKRQLEEYFAGMRREFDLPLNPEGTDFQRRVWRELVKIPYGQTVSYGKLACAVGCPGGARAVGGAAGKNPIFIIIPCHRVVARNGPGGFACGLDVKKALLGLERKGTTA
jgi:methylated-DNA-[protein]-cysteine S-methyltransferase